MEKSAVKFMDLGKLNKSKLLQQSSAMAEETNYRLTDISSFLSSLVSSGSWESTQHVVIFQ
jgi:hypothetical protein